MVLVRFQRKYQTKKISRTEEYAEVLKELIR